MAENMSSDRRRHTEYEDWPIPKQSSSIETLFTLANTSYKNKDYDKALTWYGLVLERVEETSDESTDSKYALMKSLYMISRCHMEKGNYQQAQDIVDIVCHLVISNCPENIHFPERLIIEIQVRRDDVDGAFILAIIFKHLHPSNKECDVLLTDIQAKVEESFTKSGFNIKHIFSVLATKGKQFYKNNEYSTAIAFFEKAIEVFHFLPDDNLQMAYIWLAKCLLMMGDFDQAECNVTKVLVRFPTHAKARKLHKQIVDAKTTKNEKASHDHPPAVIQQEQQPPHQPLGSMATNKKQEVKETLNKKKKRTDPKAGVASSNVHHTNNSSTWEGLPRPPNTTPKQPKTIPQPSGSSFKSVDREKVTSVGQENVPATRRDDTSRPLIEKGSPRPPNTTQKQPKTIPQPSYSSFKSVDREKVTSAGHENVPATRRDDTSRPLVEKGLRRPPNTTQEQPKPIDQPSGSSFNFVDRNKFCLFGQDDRSRSPVAKQPVIPRKESTNAKESTITQDRSQLATSDETPFQPVKTRKQYAKPKVVEKKAFRLPKEVEVTCDHFRKEVFAHPQNSSKIPKVCQTCMSSCISRRMSSYKYTYWREDLKQWINARNVPGNMRDLGKQIQICLRFQNGKMCFINCTFAHGPELQMWDLERKGDLPSPEKYLRNQEMPQGNAALQTPTKANVPTETTRKSSPEYTSGRPTPSCQNWTPVMPAHIYKTPIQTPTVQRQPPLSSTVPSRTCCLPPGVKIVCDHFIKDSKYYEMGADRKTHVCTFCGNKSRTGSVQLVRYAFWSSGFKQWFLIRPYPKELFRVAFRQCQDFIRNKPCFKKNCTFAHGPEMSMWTIEREGTLVQPWEAMFLKIIFQVTNTQHVVVRPLPIGAMQEDFRLCESVQSSIVCRFGRGCRFPHSKLELDNWKKSYKQRIEELRATRIEDPRATMSPGAKQCLMHHELELTESIPGVDLSCRPEDPNVQLAEDCDNHTYTWEFCARFKVTAGLGIPAVELQNYRQHFQFTRVHVVRFDKKSNQPVSLHNKELKEAYIPRLQLDSKAQVIEFRVTVSFQASVFGSFSQRILFNFGCQPFLKKEFNIDIGSKDTLDRLKDIRQEVNLGALSWEDGNIEIIRCEPNPEKDKLMSTYSLPKDTEIIISAQLLEGEIREDSYKQTMHQLLFAEEVYMRKLLLRLTPTNVKLQAMTTKPSRSGGTEFAKNGHLFGAIELQIEITPDDTAGRVCLRNVQSILIQSRDKPKCIYELSCEIYDGKKIFVDLTPNVCKDLKLNKDSVVDVEMRFNLNCNILCLMHKAVDSLGNTQARQLFPVEQAITRRQVTVPLEYILDSHLNYCQKRVIQEIAEVVPPSTPLVVFGPFGTGKTFTLNQAVIYLMMEKANRVLLCTHTNSAADIHVELLDEYVCGGNRMLMNAAKPLRIYSPETDLKKTSMVSRKYALIKDDIFQMPTRRNIIEHRVVITTLTSADLLTKLNVHHGFFTHILIDEAAQAWETEALIPLALAGPNTKIVFTGDHMQMSPEVYSEHAREWKLQISLPERLYDHYHAKDNKDDQVLFLFENYRSNEEILKFSSENIYGGEIVAKGNIPPHPELPPLIFYSAKGKDEKQSDNSYLNSAEVYEVEKRVAELIEKWPTCWGKKNLQDIAVVTPYGYQVKAIRDQLRRKGMSEVNVQTVHNVQGREYRALFISTVRTWNSIKDSSNQSDNFSLEFLSDPRLLITAVTRAKSLVAVVGDPFALCTLGTGCIHLWKDYILRCNNLQGLFGTTWQDLSKEVEAHFTSIQLSLDPEAPLFVPKSQISDHDDEKPRLDAGNATGNDTPNDGLLVKPEDEEDQASSCSGDVQDDTEDEDCYDCVEDSLEDQAVLQMDIDRIIKDLCKFIKHYQEKTALSDEEFPALTKCPSKVKETPITWPSKRPSKSFNAESLGSCDYRIFTRNGNPQIHLLDVFERPSQRVQQIIMNNYKQQNLEPEVLLHLLESEPSKYQSGQLRIRKFKSRTAYLVIPDKETPDIEVKGSIRHAFDQDTVVVDVQESQGLVGVLNHIISPRERQYVCKVDYKNPSLMKPINRSITCIVNLSDKSLKDIIPMYKKRKDRNERAGWPIKRITTKEVMERNLLFVVEFLQWRSDCTCPLGIAVRTISTGETIERCKIIIFAECGIRKAFNRSTNKMIRQSFPTFKIPESEIKKRTKIDNAFTIDPPQSKDLDDAVSIDNLRDGTFKVGIHIADVSYFIQRNTDLDREARQRGVSYYPGIEGEENIPMLPPKLSEDLLSILPKQDRLTVSVFVTLNSEGEVLGKSDIMRTVTSSGCRLSYSQAQAIIDEVDGETKDIPDFVREGISLLHPLALKRRKIRLREASLDHSNHREDTDAHELIEELMILANHTVGDFLHRKNANGIPFRTQLQPKVHRLNEWATNYGSLAKYSPALKVQLESEDISGEIRERNSLKEREIEIHEHAWNQIYKAVESGNHRKVERLIYDPLSSPQIATASLHLMRIQTRSQYKCSGSDTKHHSLGLSNYVHFTSPIRRYIDIEVHRLVLTRIAGSGSNEQLPLNEDDIATLCRRSTYLNENSRKFEKEFKRIHFASTMKKKNQAGVFFVDQLENRFFTIHPVNPDQDHFLSKHKKIRFDDLSPLSKSDNVDGKPETTLKWRLRIYIGHSSKDDNSSLSCSMDARQINDTIVDGKDSVNAQKIDGKTWIRIEDAIKERRPNKLLPLFQVKDIKKKLTTQKSSVNYRSTCAGRDVYKHPNFGRKDDTTISNRDDHFHEIAMNFKQFGMLSFQMISTMHCGMLCPDVQLLRLPSGICFCLEHQRYPRRCFAFDTKQFASKKVYESIDEYIRFWKPVLAMETAISAVRRNDGFILKSLPVKWSKKDEKIKGQFEFTLMNSYCKSRQIQFNYGDLACVKIPLSEDLIPQFPVNSESTIAREEAGIWVGHCVIQDTDRNVKNPDRVTVVVRIHQMATEFPQQLLTASQLKCDVEIIQQPLPQRRMITALNCKLEDSSDLVKTICLGLDPSTETFPIPNEDLSLATYFKTGFQPLNEYQTKAVKQALARPFSLIQGPPGTGKTVTGVHIAYWFAKHNQKLKSAMNQEDISESKKDTDTASPQVLYCGPSNKSVDVVTEYLLRIPGMKEKILRVHGSLIEETDYPIPNKIKFTKPYASEDELRIPGEKVREVSLHHLIRSDSSPYSKDLRQMEEEFEEARRAKKNPIASEEDVSKYCEKIEEAESWAFKKSGKEIILCTCSRAGSKKIASGCDNIQQCIIDECGMCMEPEVLVPMTSSEAKQFVLIGDHKQLQPIVIDNGAKSLGLEMSMFERLSGKATMLEIQYRMHPSICEFPSSQFYNGKLKTPDIVRFRQTANVKIWPALAEGIKVAFCHVEGVEESSVISTADSGVDSKYNEKEARKAVQVAKYLVNKHGTQINKKNVVILTPYRQQRKVIQDLLKGPYEDILVTTIIKSQGSEWNYVILSLVRSLPEKDLVPEPSSLWLNEHLGFITDDHQINVALTRAKHGLCIIGNKTLLSYDETWNGLINHCKEKKCVVDDSWPWENDKYQQFSMD